MNVSFYVSAGRWKWPGKLGKPAGKSRALSIGWQTKAIFVSNLMMSFYLSTSPEAASDII